MYAVWTNKIQANTTTPEENRLGGWTGATRSAALAASLSASFDNIIMQRRTALAARENAWFATTQESKRGGKRRYPRPCSALKHLHQPSALTNPLPPLLHPLTISCRTSRAAGMPSHLFCDTCKRVNRDIAAKFGPGQPRRAPTASSFCESAAASPSPLPPTVAAAAAAATSRATRPALLMTSASPRSRKRDAVRIA